MLTVSWLVQHVSEVPEDDAWLSESEREVLARFWAPKRRRDWRLGRWTAKRALARAGVGAVSEPDRASWTRLSVRADEAGVPCALVGDGDCEWVLSLSHSGEFGFAAVALRPATVGCDIETVGRRGEEFVVEFFTEAERRLVHRAPTPDDQSRVVTLVWSAKESALKALGVGLRLDTREVEVEVGSSTSAQATDEQWRPLAVHAPDRLLHGWWRPSGDRIVTIVTDPRPDVPVALQTR